LVATRRKQPAPRAADDKLVDLASLEPIRIAFDAHKGEPRFLTLLSPT